jgi:chorismate mutase/prephenate dehydrogenase
MPHRHKELQDSRKRIDEIDEQILDLLAERSKTVQDVIRRKIENQLPVFVPEREVEKSESFKAKAKERGIDPDWAEDFLRLIMSASRASQSQEKFPSATDWDNIEPLYTDASGDNSTINWRRIIQHILRFQLIMLHK